MKKFLPIVVAAPGAAREHFRRFDVLPQHLFRDIATEPLWEEHSSPSIYLWPFDIPYSHSDELREAIVERVGDVPAFFGMDPREAKDHQERMLSRILFDSVVVHILFLDNRKTDTTPGYEERNETYAQICTFGDIVQWSRNLKQVMDVRFLNSRSKSHHILVLVSCSQQVIVSRQEIDELNELIGSNSKDDYKPFRSCYFLDLNLVPGGTGKIFHSKYIWDVLIGRFLLALLLSQENDGNSLKPLWAKAPGVKVWRASDCTLSVKRDSSQKLLKKVLEKAAEELQEKLVSKDEHGDRLALLQDVSDNRDTLDQRLTPRWSGDEERQLKVWTEKQALFRNWSDLPVSAYEKEVESPEHWADSFAELRRKRIEWSSEHQPADHTSAVENFFSTVHGNPGELGNFIVKLFGKMESTHRSLSEQKADRVDSSWAGIVAAEKSRQQVLKQISEDSKEFQKAQNYYVGRGFALLVMVSVTAFSGWVIWRVLGLFGVGIMKILLLSGMVFAGSVVAYVLVMALHNIAGNRAAKKFMEECCDADKKMALRDELVRKMFFDGIQKRDVLTLQCVRFRTWLLATRTLSILQTELQPQLSTLVEGQEDAEQEKKAANSTDPDHVRDAYLKQTRANAGSLQVEETEKVKQKINDFISGDKPESFLNVWKELCSEDRYNAGYFPARMFISRIRGFVAHFLEEIYHSFFEESIQKSGDEIERNFLAYVQKVQSMDSESLLSAPLPQYSPNSRYSLLFINASFFESLQKNGVKDVKVEKYPSTLLETTRTAALFYQEYNVDFDLKPIPGSNKTDSGQLTFTVKRIEEDR